MHYKFRKNVQKILVTGGLGFIGGSYIRRIIKDTEIKIYNLDKNGYASDEENIENFIYKYNKIENYKLQKVDLGNFKKVKNLVHEIKPDLIVNFAAETHVDRSIDNPLNFIESNILGTFNLLQAALSYYKKLSITEQSKFVFHHISTDEVYGSLSPEGSFYEETPYKPTSPYSASKASSDHLVNAWFHTYGLPTVISNCSNNFGPFQFPEKLIPLVILKAITGKTIPIYGSGDNIRDWLFIEDHINALILIANKGQLGQCYCIGGSGETSNIKIVNKICNILDTKVPRKYKYKSLIKFVKDRPGHDKRYSIDSSKISNELGWKSEYLLDQALEITVNWYLNNIDWANRIMNRSGYIGERIGLAESD